MRAASQELHNQVELVHRLLSTVSGAALKGSEVKIKHQR